jgi:uncharacterized protein (TIGR00369 family)
MNEIPRNARSLVEAVTSQPGFANATGTRVLLAEPGRVHLTLSRRPDLLQFNGFFHGGVIAGLADHAAGGAITTALPEGLIAVTVDFSINFLAAADGDSLVAKAEAVRVGATISVARIDVTSIRGGEENPCALCVATLRAVSMPAERTG